MLRQSLHRESLPPKKRGDQECSIPTFDTRNGAAAAPHQRVDVLLRQKVDAVERI
jgi:hypothetical protein